MIKTVSELKYEHDQLQVRLMANFNNFCKEVCGKISSQIKYKPGEIQKIHSLCSFDCPKENKYLSGLEETVKEELRKAGYICLDYGLTRTNNRMGSWNLSNVYVTIKIPETEDEHIGIQG